MDKERTRILSGLITEAEFYLYKYSDTKELSEEQTESARKVAQRLYMFGELGQEYATAMKEELPIL